MPCERRRSLEVLRDSVGALWTQSADDEEPAVVDAELDVLDEAVAPDDEDDESADELVDEPEAEPDDDPDDDPDLESVL